MIGFTTVTFRNLNFEEIAEIAKKSSVRVLEAGTDVHAKGIGEAIAMAMVCQKNNIEIASLGSYFTIGKDDPKDFLSLCDIAEILNAKTIRVWLGNKSSGLYTPREVEKLREDTVFIAREAGGRGLKIAFEFHKNTYNDDAGRTVAFINNCGMDNIKTYWQPFYQGKKKDYYNLKTLMPYLENVHIFYWSRFGYRYLLKRGNIYLNVFFDLLKQNNFRGNIYIEFVKGNKVENYYKDTEYLGNRMMR